MRKFNEQSISILSSQTLSEDEQKQLNALLEKMVDKALAEGQG